MRQLWIALGMLAVMVALLAWNTAWLYSVTSPMEEDLTQGAAAGRAGDWDEAARLTQQAQQRWQDQQSRLRLVQVHGEIDELSALLGELDGTLDGQEDGEYLAASRRALEKLAAIQRAEEVNLENLF